MFFICHSTYVIYVFIKCVSLNTYQVWHPHDKLFRFQTLHPDLPATVVDIFGMLEVEIAATDDQKSKERFYWIIKSMEGVSTCCLPHSMTIYNLHSGVPTASGDASISVRKVMS